VAAPPLTRKIRRWHAERWLRSGLLLAAMLAALSVWLIDPAPLKALRNTFIDQYQRSMPRP
jgi:CHASE2 domain-containing sensor protein